MHGIIALLIPIGVSTILPICIVWIIFKAAMNNDNKRAEVLIKAIEANNGIDAEKLAEALGKPRKTPKDILYKRLLRGCIFTMTGIALIAACIILSWCGNSSVIAFRSFLLAGSVSIAIGISFLIVYFITRQQIQSSCK